MSSMISRLRPATPTQADQASGQYHQTMTQARSALEERSQALVQIGEAGGRSSRILKSAAEPGFSRPTCWS
jgi:hypothetical protein